MLKENIDQEDYDLINMLQLQCISADQTTLKLELDYKLGALEENGLGIKDINEFMYFDGQQLIGYIGIGSFGGEQAPIEVNGMVHPEYRRQGVFKMLNALVMSEWKRRNSENMLLLSDRRSVAGQKFIQGTGAKYKHTEYEMYLKKDASKPPEEQLCSIIFRKATNADAPEIARQNAIYFSDIFGNSTNSHDGNESKGIILPEEEEQRGMTIFLVEQDQQVIGKVHLQLISSIGGIYGLGVLPEHRGKGLGRAILMQAIEKLKETGANEVMLQVEAENANALNLYKSCGFEETSTMDYYEIRK